jgi:hypothetical protein
MLSQEEKMASIDKASGRPVRAGRCRTLQSLYAAARKEVFADPAAAVRKYQPTWALSMPFPIRKGPRHR